MVSLFLTATVWWFNDWGLWRSSGLTWFDHFLDLFPLLGMLDWLSHVIFLWRWMGGKPTTVTCWWDLSWWPRPDRVSFGIHRVMSDGLLDLLWSIYFRVPEDEVFKCLDSASKPSFQRDQVYSMLHPDDGAYRRFEACSPVVDKDDDQSPMSPSIFATPYLLPGEDHLKESWDILDNPVE